MDKGDRLAAAGGAHFCARGDPPRQKSALNHPEKLPPPSNRGQLPTKMHSVSKKVGVICAILQ